MWAEARKTEKQVFKLFDTSAKKKEIARRIQEQNVSSLNLFCFNYFIYRQRNHKIPL